MAYGNGYGARWELDTGVSLSPLIGPGKAPGGATEAPGGATEMPSVGMNPNMSTPPAREPKSAVGLQWGGLGPWTGRWHPESEGRQRIIYVVASRSGLLPSLLHFRILQQT